MCGLVKKTVFDTISNRDQEKTQKKKHFDSNIWERIVLFCHLERRICSRMRLALCVPPHNDKHKEPRSDPRDENINCNFTTISQDLAFSENMTPAA